MIGTVGDLVEDVVVRVDGPVHEASDTSAEVQRRRGGSAANVAANVARAGHPARFIGQVGDDRAGLALVAELRADGVDVVARRGGRTGTIVVFVDARGERTMLTDRGACTALDQPEAQWLDGLHTLHVPLYSMVGDPLARTTATLITWAHRRGIAVAVDTSSAAVIEDFGADALTELLAEIRPSVLLCNELEARTLGAVDPIGLGAGVVVVKNGPRPALVLIPGRDPVEVPALVVPDVRDTTGAGDAFAAGFLVATATGASAAVAATMGHEFAARSIMAH